MKYLSLVSVIIILSVIAASPAEDPDYGNAPETALMISPDGTVYYGTLETYEDQDWFYFPKSPYGRYRFIFANGDYNWKYMTIYQKNEFGDLVEQASLASYLNYGSSITTLFLEPEYECYIKVHSDTGNYSLRVDYLDTTPPDYYSDFCETATQLIVDAAATVGTLDHSDPVTFDTDWFVFDTLPLHKYQITLTSADNSGAYYNLYTDSCGTYITNSYSPSTLVSWAGESYKIQITGDFNRIGHYYTIAVTDLGAQNDDYGNTSSLAQPITADGQSIYGSIDYSVNHNSDQDWFVFSPAQYSRYRITFTNSDYNWKSLYVYQADEFGNLVYQNNISSYLGYGSGLTTLFFEPNYDCYLMVSNDIGDYSFKVEYLDTTLPDSYGKSCNGALEIFAGHSPLIGTLDHTNPTGFDSDWFILPTLPLHKYEITLTRADNSDAYYNLYNDSCGTYITNSSSPLTLVSWWGENYKIQITGSFNMIGHYYTIGVTDLGLQDDDWPNDYNLAPFVAKDGSWINGTLNYWGNHNSDVDWVKFTAGIDGDYTFQLDNFDYNWKSMDIYSVNAMGEPVQITSIYSYLSYGAGSATLSLTAGLHYLRMYNDNGDYRFSILSPEPRCGDLDHPYPVGDVTGDCYVNLDDVAMMAANWLQCSAPNAACQ